MTQATQTIEEPKISNAGAKILINTIHEAFQRIPLDLAKADDSHPLKDVSLYLLNYIAYLEKSLADNLIPSAVFTSRMMAVHSIQDRLNVIVQKTANPLDSFVIVGAPKVEEPQKETQNDKEPTNVESNGSGTKAAKGKDTKKSDSAAAVTKPAKPVNKRK